MKIFYKLLFCLLIFLPLNKITATGPSSVFAGIKPIAINDKGEIFCRTRFIQNSTGGHYYQNIEYGICIITQDSLLYTKTNLLMQESYPNEEDRVAHFNYWESIYNNPFNSQQMSPIEHSMTYQMDFKKMNSLDYLLNDTISLLDFQSKYNIDLRITPQLSLYGGKGIFGRECFDHNLEPSTSYCIVEYDFGNILLINNEVDESSCFGATFNYMNMFGDKDIGYDYFKVIGVVFRDSLSNR